MIIPFSRARNKDGMLTQGKTPVYSWDDATPTLEVGTLATD
ncbi:MAG: hypothetical protein ACI4QD_08440 [Kiritimatiellia bacterium]